MDQHVRPATDRPASADEPTARRRWPRLGKRAQRWLKLIHLLSAALWVGGAVALVLMNILLEATDGGELYGIDRTMKLVDDLVVIPGAMGLFLTGLLYSAFTRWGWFQHGWILFKWVVNLGGILFGTFFLGPWLDSLSAISRVAGLAALTDPTYTHHRALLLGWGTLQASTILLALVVSVLRPWRKLRER